MPVVLIIERLIKQTYPFMLGPKKKVIIFTDLDGTLLNENYSLHGAVTALKLLKKKDFPIIFCTAKTKAEQELIRKDLGVNDPFIVENGSAVYIPRNYFGKRVGKIRGKYEVIVLGTKSKEINNKINKLKRKYRIVGYHDMSFREVAERTGLELEAAKRAKRREFSETIIEIEKNALKELKKKFNVTGSNFIQVFGKKAGKGKAVRILSKLYKESYDILTIGIGNSFSDRSMLKAVDKPALVRNTDNKWVDLGIKNIYKAKGIGPKGWKEIVENFVLNKL